MTTPQLLAIARNLPCPAGPEACFYCGGPCAADYPAFRHRSDTFTVYSLVAMGAGQHQGR